MDDNNVYSQKELDALAADIAARRQEAEKTGREKYNEVSKRLIARLMILLMDSPNNSTKELQELEEIFDSLYPSARAYKDYEFFRYYSKLLAKNQSVEKLHRLQEYLEWIDKDTELLETDRKIIEEILAGINLTESRRNLME